MIQNAAAQESINHEDLRVRQLEILVAADALRDRLRAIQAQQNDLLHVLGLQEYPDEDNTGEDEKELPASTLAARRRLAATMDPHLGTRHRTR